MSMRAVLCAALLAVAAACEESDSAAFAVGVEGGRAGRCGGALVSLRAVLTVARCARGDELWARPAGGTAAVRVQRVAVADPLPPDAEPDEADQWAWGGAGAELALLELEDTLPGMRPILAAPAGECAPSAECHVPRLRHGRLRIMEAALEPAARCVARGARWPTPMRERALCLLGPRLCESDWGAGVVCGGKLCGVMAWSAQSEALPPPAPAPGEGPETGRCGDTHAAASVSHGRRFLHCALVHGSCGRGECERLCSERWLGPEEARRKAGGGGAPTSDVTAPSEPPTTAPSEPPRTAPSAAATTAEAKAGKGREAQSVAPPAGKKGERHKAPLVGKESGRRAESRDRLDAHASTLNALEFEPNRPDFKAGEYGDSAADYGAEYGGPAASLPVPTRTEPAPTSPRRTADVEAQVAQGARPAALPPPAEPRHRTSAAHTHTPLCILPFAFLFGT